MNEAVISVRDYHERSKHHLERYARGPATLDWDSQPNPFRHFTGSATDSLPLLGEDDSPAFQALYQPGSIPPRPLERDSLGMLLQFSLGLSAWKSFGPDRWSLRINPSSGNLHPTEAYLVLPAVDDILAGVYHYHSYAHELEQRTTFASQAAGRLPAGSLLLGLSSIHKRESWKYGERAYRYCQHDVGHALAAIRYACALLGWECLLLDECSDDQLAQLLGLNRTQDFDKAEREAPDLLVQINTTVQSARIQLDPLIAALAQAEWHGRANQLTEDNFYKWPVIEEAELACRKPVTTHSDWLIPVQPALPPCDPALSATGVIRQRRSAQAFDGGAPPLGREQFTRILHTLLPRPGIPPLDCLPWAPRVHLILFVHRVEGMAPGLYALPRSEAGTVRLRDQLRDEFAWQAAWGEQAGLPLYLLLQAGAANSARTLACHQPIASDSAFSLAMLAEFDEVIDTAPWHYRQLFWEAGLLGQALYLEAEAAGVRGTGIGCYFDDAVHELLGIRDTRLQDLYHFTVGTPRIDARLQSEPPYAHLV